jgi:hypothetical protein
MRNKYAVVRGLLLVVSIALAGCRQAASHSLDPAGIVEVRIVPTNQVETNQQVTTDIMPVLEALFWGTIEDRRALVQYISVGCTTADGLGGPPKCLPGEAEGTLVEVFPVGEAEGTFVRPEEIDGTLELLSVEGLYAVYQPVPGVDPVEYWPIGEYALIFERRLYNTSLPVTAFVQEGKMVRLNFTNYPIETEQLLSSIPLDRVLMSPNEARTLTEQVQSPR